MEQPAPESDFAREGRYEAARTELRLILDRNMHPAHAQFCDLERLEALTVELLELAVDAPDRARREAGAREAAALAAAPVAGPAAAGAAAGGDEDGDEDEDEDPAPRRRARGGRRTTR